VTQPTSFNQFAPIAERFEQFHAENPRVYETLRNLARQWIASTGRTKLGMKALFERARWELVIATKDPDFVLNNNFTAYYARLLMHQESDLAGLFDLRRSDADEWLALQVAS
jgi:hypothetical protein